MAKKFSSLDDLKNLKIGPESDKPGPITARSVKAALKKGALKPSAPSAAPAEPPAPEPAPPGEDETTFFAAMRGVARIHPEDGRQVAAKPPVAAPPARPDPAEGPTRHLEQLLRGEVDFELEFSEEYMHGYVRGLDAKIFQQLRAGRFSYEGHMDMHGLNAEQAYENLLFFLRESYHLGRRCVLLVTGRGRNSPGGLSVLKQEIQTWLTREPLRRVVLAFSTAQPKDGGAGALYVLLRSRKKTQGKVRWDTLANWDPEDI